MPLKRATRSDSASSGAKTAKKHKRPVIWDTEDEESDQDSKTCQDEEQDEDQDEDQDKEQDKEQGQESLTHCDDEASAKGKRGGNKDKDNEEEDDDNNDDEAFIFDQNQEGSPSKSKAIESISAFKTSGAGGGETPSIKLAQGGCELIGVHKPNGDDGFFLLVCKAIYEGHAGICSHGFVAVATRCIEPGSARPLLNSEAPASSCTICGNRNSNSKPCPKQHIVRVVNRSSKKSRREVVNCVAGFLNKENRQSPPPEETKKDGQNAQMKGALFPPTLTEPLKSSANCGPWTATSPPDASWRSSTNALTMCPRIGRRRI